MSDSIFPPRKKKAPVELQLTAMIDVFSMIVIFLIFGTVFGAADIVVPQNLTIPKSQSKEGIDSAPMVLINDGHVKISISDVSFPIHSFKDSEGRKALKSALQSALDGYQARRKGTAGAGSNPLNLLADQAAPYEQIYDVVAAFRELGFDSVYFVATGERRK